MDEYGHDVGTLPPEVPKPLYRAGVLGSPPSGRLSVTMTKLFEICNRDTRMGRRQG